MYQEMTRGCLQHHQCLIKFPLWSEKIPCDGPNSGQRGEEIAVHSFLFTQMPAATVLVTNKGDKPTAVISYISSEKELRFFTFNRADNHPPRKRDQKYTTWNRIPRSRIEIINENQI